MGHVEKIRLGYFLLVFFISLGLFLFGSYYSYLGSFLLKLGGCLGSGVFIDYPGFIMFLLTVIIGLGLFLTLTFYLDHGLLIFARIISCLFCYFCSSSLGFWVFYEVSILFLLFSLVLRSPYSERYLATWYFYGYIFFFSTPMVFCIFYLSFFWGGYDFLFWRGHSCFLGCFTCLLVLGVCFISKVPLFPFHGWLPVVHAESPSSASVCLSGYIMKLGILGLYRFCGDFLPLYLITSPYVWFLGASSISFFMISFLEADKKRWIAFLSLSHIVISVLSLHLSRCLSFSVPFLYCFGHGLSAALRFVLFWFLREVCGSRSWIVIRGVWLKCPLLCYFTILSLFSVASIPPTLTFVSEVVVLGDSLSHGDYFLAMVICIYLFFSSLVPLFFVSILLGAKISYSKSENYRLSFFRSLLYFIFWGFFIFFFIG